MTFLSIQAAFAAQVERSPEAVAVSFGDVRHTYRELDQRSNQLARRLIGLGVGPRTPVAVAMTRSADLVVATLAVIKAGGFYLPLHDAYPIDRQQWIVDQAGVGVLLTDEVTRARGVPRTEHVVTVSGEESLTPSMPSISPTPQPPSMPPQVDTLPDHLAYVIYTSGSTGEPKGVAVAHRDVLGLALDSCWDGGRHERVLMVAPYAFNVSTYEVWVPLLHGGQIVVAPPGNLEVAALRRLIRDEEITGIHLTAGLFRVIAEESPESLSGLREVLTGGDVIAPTAVRRVLAACPGIVVRAMYGATEMTLFSTQSPVTTADLGGTTVPVGAPMDGVRFVVLDDRLGEVTKGEVGELYLAGRGMARGYFGRPDLTSERFVADPFTGTGERIYRTGDLVRVNRDTGALEFVGRANDQVKILGFRVELGEIESVLARHPGLAHVAVVAQETKTGERRLAAYIVPESADFDVAALRTHAGGLLPEYMVPAAFVVVEQLPLTANGKLDRRALPEPDFEHQFTYRAPQTPRQEALCAIFAEILDVPRVGLDDNFFDLGGQSLLALRLISRIRAVLGVDLKISLLFDAATVASLEPHLDVATGQPLPGAVPA